MGATADPDSTTLTVERRAATPIAGAIAGILFAVLFGVSVTILDKTMADVAGTGAWLGAGAAAFKFALGLMPFAGIFFLWFIAVTRSGWGALRTSSSRPCFSAAACSFWPGVRRRGGGGSYRGLGTRAPSTFAAGDTYLYARQIIAQIFAVYALRMAAVFLLSQATLCAHRRDAPLDGAAHVPRGAHPALCLHTRLVGDPGLPRRGVPRQRVYPGGASRRCQDPPGVTVRRTRSIQSGSTKKNTERPR